MAMFRTTRQACTTLLGLLAWAVAPMAAATDAAAPRRPHPICIRFTQQDPGVPYADDLARFAERRRWLQCLVAFRPDPKDSPADQQADADEVRRSIAGLRDHLQLLGQRIAEQERAPAPLLPGLRAHAPQPERAAHLSALLSPLSPALRQDQPPARNPQRLAAAGFTRLAGSDGAASLWLRDLAPHTRVMVFTAPAPAPGGTHVLLWLMAPGSHALDWFQALSAQQQGLAGAGETVLHSQARCHWGRFLFERRVRFADGSELSREDGQDAVLTFEGPGARDAFAQALPQLKAGGAEALAELSVHRHRTRVPGPHSVSCTPEFGPLLLPAIGQIGQARGDFRQLWAGLEGGTREIQGVTVLVQAEYLNDRVEALTLEALSGPGVDTAALVRHEQAQALLARVLGPPSLRNDATDAAGRLTREVTVWRLGDDVAAVLGSRPGESPVRPLVRITR